MRPCAAPPTRSPAPERCHDGLGAARHRRRGGRGAHRPHASLVVARGLRDPLRRARLADDLRPAVLEGLTAGQEGAQRPHGACPGRARRRSTGRGRGRRRSRPHPPGQGRHRERADPACSPRPTSAPRPCSSTDGHASRPRSSSSRPRPTPTSRSSAAVAVDEMRGEIARLAALTAERVVAGTLDDETQQRLIEDFIANVGASTPPGRQSRERVSASERAAASGLRGRGTLEGSDDPRSRAMRARCSRWPEPRGRSTRWRTSCSASPAPTSPARSCATPSATS